MSRSLRRVSLVACAVVFAAIRVVAADYRRLFIDHDTTAAADALFTCVNRTALRLFNDGNRVGLICYRCDRLENEIIRRFMKDRAMVVSDRPLWIRNRRAVSYVIFASETFAESRRHLLTMRRRKDDVHLHTTQYLFVSAAARETVRVFASDLWRAGFRDIAFLTLNAASGGARATIHVPAMNRTIVLRPVGHCSSSGWNDLDRIAPYSADFYRFCVRQPCTIFHGAVADDTVQFWRGEDQLKLSETDGYEPMEVMLIQRFTSFFGIQAHYGDANLTWPAAARKLLDGELDIIAGLMPENLEVLEGLQVVCWYRDRRLTFAAQVRRRPRDHPVLQLLTPFHHSVWICALVMLLLYVSLLYALRKLAGVGLIEERPRFVQIYEIMLGQGVALPRRMSLRAVLALWMIFSLNLSIIYNSTFTSSLADRDTEDLLRNLRELRDSGMPLCGPAIVQKFLNDSDDPVVTDLRDRYRVMKRAEETFDAIMSNNTMGVVQHMTVDRMNWATRTDRNLRIYTLPQPVLTFPILFYTRAEHPYRVPFERVVTEYRESGLLYMWVKYYVIDEDKQIAASHGGNDDDEGGILNMEHLGPVFKFFFMCQVISVLILFVELFRFYVLEVQRSDVAA